MKDSLIYKSKSTDEIQERLYVLVSSVRQEINEKSSISDSDSDNEFGEDYRVENVDKLIEVEDNKAQKELSDLVNRINTEVHNEKANENIFNLEEVEKEGNEILRQIFTNTIENQNVICTPTNRNKKRSELDYENHDRNLTPSIARRTRFQI